MIDRSLSDIGPDLFAGETLLWSGSPRPGILLRSRDWFMIPFGTFFLFMGLSLPISIMSFPTSPPDNSSPPPLFFVIFTLPFVVIGTWFSFGHLLWERAIRAKSRYALTDQHVIIVQDRRHKTVKSIPLKDIADIGLTVGRDGVGTITFNESANPVLPFMYNMMWAPQSSPAFELIDGAAEVYRRIGDARAKLQP